MLKKLPIQAEKYFWGDNLQELNWQNHKKYIAQTLLDRGDSASISWLFKQISPKEILVMLPSLKINHKSRNFWTVYLS